jgi:hypothetical protein
VIGTIKTGGYPVETLLLAEELKHYVPLIKTVCRNAERSQIKKETVPESNRIFSIFEEHTERMK